MLNASTCPVAFLVSEARALRNVTADEFLAADLAASLPASVGLAVALLAASLVILFAGRRLVQPTFFLVSFGTIALLTLAFLPVALDAAGGLSDEAECLTVGITPIVTGLVAGLFAMFSASSWRYNFGFALLGAGAGAGAGYILYLAALNRWPIEIINDSGTSLTFVLCLSGGALLGTAALLRYKEAIMIVSTALVGAVGTTIALALCLAHADVKFLGAFKPSASSPSDPVIWGSACVALLLFALGAAVQFRHEGKAVDGLHLQRRPFLVSTSGTQYGVP